MFFFLIVELIEANVERPFVLITGFMTFMLQDNNKHYAIEALI